MNTDDLTIIINNNKAVEKLLKENEEILSRAGYNPPTNNYVLLPQHRIGIPSGYIRKSGDFWMKYKLPEIICDKNVQDNISYALQLSDFYNYLFNRLSIWGSIETMLYKQDFINLVSIIEAIILASAVNIRNSCKECKSSKKCRNFISARSSEYIKDAISKFCETGILDYSDTQNKRLIELIDIRNRIHIRLAKKNEFLDARFNVELHNETITYLIEITEQISKNALKYYKKCMGFMEMPR